MNEESTLEFPCEYPLKLMGRDEPDFHTAAQMILKNHLGKLDDDCVSLRNSRNGKFVALTVTFTATSREQLDALYHDLSESVHVLIAL
jgi:hypothetical protein